MAEAPTIAIAAIEGFVERFDVADGIEGWAIDRHDPSRCLTIELRSGAVRLALTQTSVERPDVCEALGIGSRPGFRFPSTVIDEIRVAAENGAIDGLTVCVSGEDEAFALPGKTLTPDAVRIQLARADVATKDGLAELLAIHADTASELLQRPLPPLPDRASGFIDAMWPDGSGLVWLTGWFAEDTVMDRPVIVLDDETHGAGFAYAIVRRDDLPAGRVGFVGVLLTGWRPGQTATPYLLMADAADHFLEPFLPTPLRTRQAIGAVIAHYLARCEGRYRDLLHDLFHAPIQWGTPETRSVADQLQVDEFFILPGFGAFVSGWALSPSKDAESFTLKVGNRVIAADPRSIFRHERPDLATVYPTLADTTEAAGFVALFRGTFAASSADELIVKAIWNDGSSTNDRVAPGTIRVLGLTAPLDAAYRFYSGLEAGHFFADFAHHAALNARVQASDVRPYVVQPVADVLIFAVPKTSSDLFLMYDNIVRHAGYLPETWGIALIAESDHARSILLSLLGDMKRATERPVSLFFTKRGRPSTYALEVMLQALGAKRFAFAGASAYLTRIGWQAIGERREGVTILTESEQPGPNAALTEAFAADRSAWREIVAAAPPMIGGIDVMRGCSMRSTHRHVVSNATMSLGTQYSTPLIERINQIVGQSRD